MTGKTESAIGGGSPERSAPHEAPERGRRGTYDPVSGEVSGSGSGAGGGGNPGEDHDDDPMAGSGSEPEGGPRPIGRTVDPIDADGNI